MVRWATRRLTFRAAGAEGVLTTFASPSVPLVGMARPQDSAATTGPRCINAEVQIMQDKPEHHCGVVGFALSCDAVPYLKKGLRIIQHRGQEAAGVAVSVGKSIKYLRGMGLVHEVLAGRNFDALVGQPRHRTCPLQHDRLELCGELPADHGHHHGRRHRLGAQW